MDEQMTQDVTAQAGLTQNQRMFLAAYEACGSITKACETSGLSRRSHFRWLHDSDYQAAFDESRQVACDVLELEARRRAVEGTRKYLFHKGEPIIDPRTGEHYYETRYSDRMLIVLLKAAMPEKYGDRIQVDSRPKYTEEDLERFAEQHGLKQLEDKLRD